MLVIFGSYHWAPKIIAYRRDWCTVCQGESLALGRRTFDFGHVFWIPLLPLGRWTRWYCGQCGQDPSSSVETRRSLRIVAFLMVAALMAGLLATTFDTGMTGATAWLVRAFAMLVVVGMGWWAFRAPGALSYKERRQSVQPYAGSECPVCDGPLLRSLTDTACSVCAAEHRPIRSKDSVLSPVT